MVTSLRSKWAAGKAVRAGLAVEGAYLNRYVTDEQRGRRPIFNATLRAGASWLFFRVARSTRMTQVWALRSRLEKQPTDLRRRHHYLRDGALASRCSVFEEADKSWSFRLHATAGPRLCAVQVRQLLTTVGHNYAGA
jgi:hypothetical protein